MTETLTIWQLCQPQSGYFFEEGFLAAALLGQILISLFSKSSLETLSDQKKFFFFLTRYTQVCLFVVLAISLGSFIQMPDPSLTETVLLHTGNFFFRQDWVTKLLVFVITFLGFHYLHTLLISFAHTKATVTYASEIPILLLTALISLRLFLLTNDFMLMLIVLEIAAFCSIILIGMQSLSTILISLPLESALKYFAMNAFAGSFLFLGLANYYQLTGVVNLIDMANYFLFYPFLYPFVFNQLLVAHLIFFFSYFIKLGAAPFHQWVADVYEGAETSITAFLVLLISPALNFKLFVLFQQLSFFPGGQATVLLDFFTVCGLLSIIIGTFNAFYQTRIKRFIAYASITHLGFLLLALSCQSLLGSFSFFVYLLVYIFTNICFFSLLVLGQNRYQKTILVYLSQWKALFQTNQTFFLSLFVILLSFAGLPPFAGFFGKLFVLLSLIDVRSFSLIIFLLVYILIGAYMYLRVLKIALFEGATLQFYSVFQTFDYFHITTELSTQKPSISVRLGSLALSHSYWFLIFLGFFWLFLPVIGNFFLTTCINVLLVF